VDYTHESVTEDTQLPRNSSINKSKAMPFSLPWI